MSIADPLAQPRRPVVVVQQSNYLPWKGYFDLLHDADLFVFYDDVAYTKNDWRNRNRIKTPTGPAWLTIPIGRRHGRLICEVEIGADDWQAAHWRRISASYGRAPAFGDIAGWLEEQLVHRRWRNLSELNQSLVTDISRQFLGLRGQIIDSRSLGAVGVKQDRLLDLLGRLGAATYVSGPAGKAYIDPERFAAAGIDLVWKDYAGYPEYPQLYPPFTHEVSIIDLLAHVGAAGTADAIWGWRQRRPAGGGEL